MSFINTIKNTFGAYFLRQDMKGLTRDRGMLSLEDSKTIGILFDAGDKEEFELVKKYVIYLRELKKKVKVVGFFSKGTSADFTYSKLEYDFFTQKETTWYNKPSNKFVNNFIAEEFDILIDLNIHDHFPLRYTAGTSRARFKVGRKKEGDECIYDLMIEGTEGKGLKYFLRQADTYLQMLRKPESA